MDRTTWRKPAMIVIILALLLFVFNTLNSKHQGIPESPKPPEKVTKSIRASSDGGAGASRSPRPDASWFSTDDSPPVKYTKPPRPFLGPITILDNGLTVILVEDHSAPTIAAHLVVRTGAARDAPGMAGTAHFLEHMMFKGTERLGTSDWGEEAPFLDELRELHDALPNTEGRERRMIQREIERAHAEADLHAIPNEFFRALDEIGATRVNAHTSLDYTDYCALLPANKLEPWAILEADRFSNPVFRGFGNERKVVEQEIRYRKGLSESATTSLVRVALFDGHPYGASLGGTLDSLSNITISTIEDFYDAWYIPGNAAVVLVGDLQRAEALSIIEETFGAIPPGPEPPGRVHPVQSRKSVKRLEGNTDRDNALHLAWRIVDPAPADYAALRVFTALLTKKRTKQREEPRSIHARVRRYTRGGWLMVTAECEERRDSRTCERLVLQRLKEVANGVTQGRIYAAARAIEIHLLESLEDHHAHAKAIVRGFARGKTPEDLWRGFHDVRLLSPDHLRAAVQRHLGDDYIVVKPGKSPAVSHEENRQSSANLSTDIDDEASSPFYRWVTTMPTPEIPDQWLTSGEEYTETADGRVIAVYNPCNTLFELHLSYPVGWMNDPHLCHALSLWEAAAGDAEAGAWGRPLFREGVMVKIACREQSAELTLRGPGEAFGFAAPYLLEQLKTPVLMETNAESRKARLHGRCSRALAAYAIHGDLSPYATRFARNEELKEAPGRRFEKAVSALARFEPDVVYAGPHEERYIASAFQEKGADPDPPEPGWIPYSIPPRNKILLHHHSETSVALVRFYRVGEPCDNSREAIYALADEYLTGLTGIVFEQVREADGSAYAVKAFYKRGKREGAPNLTTASLATSSPMKVVEQLMGALTRASIEPARWARVRNAALEHSWSEHIPFREAGKRIRKWKTRGIDGDAREFAHQDLAVVEREEFESFLALEADIPMVVVITGNLHTLDIGRLKKLADLQVVTYEMLFR